MIQASLAMLFRPFAESTSLLFITLHFQAVMVAIRSVSDDSQALRSASEGPSVRPCLQVSSCSEKYIGAK